MIRLVILICLLASSSFAETLVATRTVRAQEVLSASDLALSDVASSGALDHPSQAIGMEAKIALYPGRPIRPDDVGPPAIVERNGIITLVYQQGGLYISTEGRALGRAAVGETVRVMNISSRTTVFARIHEDGRAYVQ